MSPISTGTPPGPGRRPAPLKRHHLPYLEASDELRSAARAAIGNARKNARATATNKVSSDWQLSDEDVTALILRAGGRCELSGMPFDLTPDPRSLTRRRPKAPSLDRIDNRKGYTLKNSQLVLQLVNMAKSDCSQASLLELLQFSAGNAPDLQVAVDARVLALTPGLEEREQAVLAAEVRLKQQATDLEVRVYALGKTENLLVELLADVRESTLRAVQRPPVQDPDTGRTSAAATARREYAELKQHWMIERLEALVLQDAELIRRPVIPQQPTGTLDLLGIVAQLTLRDLERRPLPRACGNPGTRRYSSSREWLRDIGCYTQNDALAPVIDAKLRTLLPQAPQYWSYSADDCVKAVRAAVEDLPRAPALNELTFG